MQDERDVQRDERAGQHQPDASGTETGPVQPGPPNAETDPANVERSATESGRKVGAEDREAERDEDGLLVGTGSERAPGVGDASHPAPAAMLREDGLAHVAGESPVGTTPASSGYDPGDTPSGATTEEARERLNAVKEPERHDTKRPDIGTE